MEDTDLKKTARNTKRNPQGTAYVVFLANLETIKKTLTEGWTVRATFNQHTEKLAGKISYEQFARYVKRLRAAEPDAPYSRPPLAPPHAISSPPAAKESAASVPPPAPAKPPAPEPAPATEGSATDARHHDRPARRPAFSHDGNISESDKDRLIGRRKE